MKYEVKEDIVYNVITLYYDHEIIAEISDGRIYGTRENIEEHYEAIVKFANNHGLTEWDIREE